ncbi:expressed unknown protein (Partial), partial [Seminavis robusta]|eukprot:Sro3763_g350890.1 n/a (88) ;mRNA; f:4571-4834
MSAVIPKVSEFRGSYGGGDSEKVYESGLDASAGRMAKLRAKKKALRESKKRGSSTNTAPSPEEVVQREELEQEEPVVDHARRSEDEDD